MFRRQLLAVVAVFALVIAGTASFSVQAAQSSQPAGSTPAQTGASVTIAHLAPFSASNTLATVVVNEAPVGSLSYKETLSVPSLPAGSYDVEVFAGTDTTGTAAITDTLMLEAGKDYTVAAVGDGANIPLQLLVLENDNTAPAEGNFRVRVAHAAPFAPQAGTAVDIFGQSQAGNVDLGLSGIFFGDASNYLTLPAAAPLDVVVFASGTTTPVLDPDPVSFSAGSVVTIFAIGGANGALPEVFTLDQTPAETPTEPEFNARVRVAHLAPFDAEDTTATVVVNGIPIGALSYKETVDYLPLPPGDYQVQVFAGTDTTVTPAISETLTFESGMDYTVAAVGDGTDIPLALWQLTDDNTPPASTSNSVRVAHAAPFAPLAQTGVNILGQPGNVSLGLNGIPFGTASPFLALPAGELDVVVVSAADPSTVIFDPAALTLPGGAILSVFAIGGANDYPAELFILEGSQRPMAQIRAAHFAPFSNNTQDMRVNVLAGPEGGPVGPLFTDLDYTEITEYVSVPEGVYEVQVVVPDQGPNTAQTVVVTALVTLQSGVPYTAVAVGDGDTQSIELLLLNDGLAPISDKARIRVVHTVPVAAAASVDVRLEDDTIVFDDLGYKEVVNTTVDPGFIDLKVTTADGATTLLDPGQFYVGPGDVVTVFATGGANNQELMLVTTGNSQSFNLYLPMIYNGAAAPTQ